MPAASKSESSEPARTCAAGANQFHHRIKCLGGLVNVEPDIGARDPDKAVDVDVGVIVDDAVDFKAEPPYFVAGFEIGCQRTEALGRARRGVDAGALTGRWFRLQDVLDVAIVRQFVHRNPRQAPGVGPTTS